MDRASMNRPDPSTDKPVQPKADDTATGDRHSHEKAAGDDKADGNK